MSKITIKQKKNGDMVIKVTKEMCSKIKIETLNNGVKYINIS